MSREILHELLRAELGYTGLVVTDALEMKAISATVGVEEGAVRSLAAGADALCLGHDLFDEAVVGVRDALVDAVRTGLLAEERLREAARAGRGSRSLGARAARESHVDRAAGRAAAHRALRCEGACASIGLRSSSSSCPRPEWRRVACRSFPASGSEA